MSMASEQSPATIALGRVTYWSGYLNGTNRGRVLIRMCSKADRVFTAGLLQDNRFGPARIEANGPINGNTANLRILSVQSRAPIDPLDGLIDIKFSPDGTTAEGTWSTDAGAAGHCRLVKTKYLYLRWCWKSFSAAIGRCLHRNKARIYLVLILALACLSIFKKIDLRYPSLALILLIAIYAFEDQIVHLIEVFRLKKFGPVEFREQGPLSPEIKAAIAGASPQANRFALTDVSFALRTKLVLLSLVQRVSISRADFEKLAASLGITDEYVERTWQALIVTGCASVECDRMIISQYGIQYGQHLLGLA